MLDVLHLDGGSSSMHATHKSYTSYCFSTKAPCFVPLAPKAIQRF